MFLFYKMINLNLCLLLVYGPFLFGDEVDKYGPPKIRKEFEYFGKINSFAFSPDGKSLVAGDSDGFFIYHIPSWKEGKRIFYPDFISELTFSPTGKTLAVSFPDTGEGKRIGNAIVYDPNLFKSHLHLYDTANWQPKFDALISNSLPGKLRFSPDGKYLVCGQGRKDTEHTLLFWDPATGKQVFSAKLGRQKPGFLLALAFSPNGQWLACGGRGDGAVRLWNVREKKETAFFQIEKPELNPQNYPWIIWDLAFSPDSKLLAIASHDPGLLTIIDVASKKIVREEKSRFAFGLAFSPDGKWLLAGGVGVFQTKNWERVPGFHTRKHSLRFSPDGCWLAAAEGGNLEVWDWAQYQKGLMVRLFERKLEEIQAQPKPKRENKKGASSFLPSGAGCHAHGFTWAWEPPHCRLALA